jgi:caffeoyl-CoA O-methyltransferase
MNQELFSAIDTYIGTLFFPQDDILEAVLHASEEAGLPRVNVSPAQGHLLHLLALLCRARTILEIGTLGGYSAIWMARALPEGGRLITLDKNPAHVQIARKNIARAGLESTIEVRQGESFDILAALEAEQAGPFDMIFLDADKEPYPDYLQWALRLTQPGSLIVADNTIRHGDILDEAFTDPGIEGIRRFNTMLAANPNLAATILQTVGVKGHDGMSLAYVKG